MAKKLGDDCFGIVFGVNNLLALAFQTILTAVFVSGNGFALGLRDQFIVYSLYFFVLASPYAVALMWNAYKNKSGR